MSELKTYNSERIYCAVEQVEQEAGDIEDLHLDDNLFYLKEKADEAIAELKAENERLKRALYKACANWAHFAVAFFSSYATKERWYNMEIKCLKKAKEYR